MNTPSQLASSATVTPKQNQYSQADLDRDRGKNDYKLKCRFEHIFSKYEHDFTGVGDEIDLESGEIVVNNGHLQHMRSENDPGKSADASSRFVRTVFQKLEHEDDEDDEDDDEDDEDEDEDEDEDGQSTLASTAVRYNTRSRGERNGDGVDQLYHILKQFERESEQQLRSRQDLVSISTGHSALPSPHLPTTSRPMPRLTQFILGDGTAQKPFELLDRAESPLESHTESVVGSTRPNPNSVRSLQSPAPAPSEAGTDAIQALGHSIATQLAQLIQPPTRKKSRKSKVNAPKKPTESIWDYPEITRSTRKHPRSPVRQHPPSSPTQSSPENGSLWAVEDGRKRRRVANLDDAAASTVLEVKRCWNCSLTRSSTWHKGPHNQDLCLSCHQYYQHHGRMKGFDSPTPSVEFEAQEQEDVKPSVAEPDITPFDSPLEVNQPDDCHQQYLESQPQVPVSDYSLATDRTQAWLEEQPCQPPTLPPTAAARETVPSSAYPANTSRQLLANPSGIRINSWAPDEDAKIIHLKEKLGLSWDAIAQHFPFRTQYSVQAHYSTRLCGKDSAIRTFVESQGPTIGESIPPMPQVEWNEEEDEKLLALRESDELDWPEIAQRIPYCTPEAAMSRYNLLESQNPPPPKPLRDAYTPEEDVLIVRLKEAECLSWNQIAFRFPTRPLQSLQKRYSSKLAPGRRLLKKTLANDPIQGTMADRLLAVDPEIVNVGSSWPSLAAADRTPFAPQEDALLRQLREDSHLNWDEISARLSGRSPKRIEHRYGYKFFQAFWQVREQERRRKELEYRFFPTPPTASELRPSTFDLEITSSTAGDGAKNPQQSVENPTQHVARESSAKQPVNIVKATPRHRHSMPASVASRAAATPLLRQALGNSRRRRSDNLHRPVPAIGDSHSPVRRDSTGECNPDSSSPIQATSEAPMTSRIPSPSDIGATADPDFESVTNQDSRFPKKGRLKGHPVRQRNEPDPPTKERQVAMEDQAQDRSSSHRNGEVIDLTLLPDCFDDESNDLVGKAEIRKKKTPQRAPTLPTFTPFQLVQKAFEASDSPTLTCNDIFAWVEENHSTYCSRRRSWRGELRNLINQNAVFQKLPGRIARGARWTMMRDETGEEAAVSTPQKCSDVQDNPSQLSPDPIDNAPCELLVTNNPIRPVETDQNTVDPQPAVQVSLPESAVQDLSALSAYQPFMGPVEIAASDEEDDLELPATPVATADRGRVRRGAQDAATPKPQQTKARKQTSVASGSQKCTTPMPTPSAYRFQEGRTTPSIGRLRTINTPVKNYKYSSSFGPIRKRVVDTPARELADPEEDELAD